MGRLIYLAGDTGDLMQGIIKGLQNYQYEVSGSHSGTEFIDFFIE